jgi:hypothetical protein
MPSTERTSVPALVYLLTKDPKALAEVTEQSGHKITLANLPDAWRADLPDLAGNGGGPSPNRKGVAICCEIEWCMVRDRARALAYLVLAATIFGGQQPLFLVEVWPLDYWEWHADYSQVFACQAKRLGRLDIFRDFAEQLHAILAGLVLGVVLGAQRELTEAEATGEQPPSKPIVADGARHGPAAGVAMAGCRGLTKAAEADQDGDGKLDRIYWSHVVDTARSAVVLAAAGRAVEERWWRGLKQFSEACARLAGERLFFLSDLQRGAIAAFLVRPTDLAAAGSMVEILEPCPVMFRHSWRRYEHGVAVLQEEWGDSSTAPMVVQCLDDSGVTVSASPFTGQRESGAGSADQVAPGKASWTGTHEVTAQRADGKFSPWRFRLPADRLGALVHEVTHYMGGAVVRTMAGPPPPKPGPAPQPPAPQPPAPLPPADRPRPKKRRSNSLPILLAAAALVGLLLWWLS